MNKEAKEWLRDVVHSLKEVDISDLGMPAYRGVPLTAFKRDDLIRIAKLASENVDAVFVVHEKRRYGVLICPDTVPESVTKSLPFWEYPDRVTIAIRRQTDE